MAKIMYVGKKPSKKDNVAGTEAFWARHGDVQEVTDPETVEKLLKHTDCWRLVADEEAERGDGVQAGTMPADTVIPEAKTTKPSKAKSKVKPIEDENTDLPPVVNFQRLGRDAIEAYARKHLGYEVDQRHKLADIRENAQRTYNRIVSRGGK